MPINLGNIKKLEEEKKKLLQEQNNLNVGSNTSTQNAILTNNNSNRTWLKSGAFSDGYQAGDITKTVLGTAGDIGSNLLKGVVRAGEGIGDLLAYGGAQIVDWLGNEEYANQVRQNASEDLTGKIFSGLDNVIEPNSVLGEKSQSVVSSIGQMYASAVTSSKVLGTKGNIGLNIGGKKFNIPTTSIISGASSGMGEAYQKGAEDWQAWLTGAGGGLAEGLSESLFGTFGLGGSALDDALVKSVTQNMRSGLAKSMTKAGIKAAGEGVEEVVSYLLDYGSKQAIDYGKKTFNLSGPDLAEKFNSEELWENFFSGALAAAIGGLPSTISEVRGNTPQFNVNEGYRQNRTSLPIIKNNTTNNLNSMRYSLNENGINAPIANNDGTIVNPNRFQYVKSDNIKIDNLRKSASQYFNNSQETQSFMNTIEKVIADKNYNVVFDNTLKSKNGNSVNAQITTNKNGGVEIKINPNSNRAGEFLLVHEITHAIETDNMKKLVLDYASKNSEFNTALESLKQTYGTNDVNSEVLADISGQLFGNQEFIDNLSVEQPNIFRRIYNKIIELANKITGNSHEALFIRDLRNKWENAYRNTTTEQAVNNLNTNTVFSIQTDANGNRYVNVDTDQDIFAGKNLAEQNKIAKKYILDHFRGNELTYNNENINVNNKTATKYTNPQEKITRNNKNVKNRISTELDNLLSVSEKISESTDKKSHAFAKDGWEYYKTTFNIDGNYFTGILNIGKNGTQKTLYDITNIKKTTQNGKLDNSSVISNKSSFSDNNITNSKENVKLPSAKYSMQENQNDTNIQRYDDLSKTNHIEYFRKDNGDVRVNLIDSNNNLINQLDLWSNTEAIKQFGEKLGNQLYNYATDNNQKINIGNDINNLGLETDYFMSHRPTQTGLTADNLINQNVETPMPKDIYNHPEYYFQMSEKSSQESMSVLRKVRGNPNAEVTIYRATPGNKINKGDWITLSKSYAEWHNQSQFDGKANVLEMKVKAKDVQYAGDDINEFGYFPDGDIKNSISNKTWQEYLEENYLSSGTRTNMQNIKIPTAQDIKRVENNNIDLPNPNRVLNPLEISQLNPEDASTTPPLPKDPTRESSYEDASLEEIAQILDEKPVTEKRKDNRAKVFLATKFLDKGYYVDKLARQYKNRELSAKYDYSLLHNGIANEIIGNGRYDSEGNKIGKSLYEIFAPIEESNLTREFSEYLYHLHNIDRMSLKETHNEDNKPVFGSSVTAERSQEIVDGLIRKYPEFGAYAQDIYDFNNANLQMLVDNGVISKEDMDYYNKKYPHYVPIIRNNTNTKNQMIYLAGKAATVGVPIKKAKGGNSDIIPLKEAMAMRTMQTVNSALKNDFGLELLHTIYGENTNEVVENTQSLDETIDEMDSTKIVEPKTSDREATFTVYQNGKKITMEISDEIYEALTPRRTGTIKPLHSFNNFRRAVLTEYSPAFMLTNPIKDIQDGSINSKHPTQFLKNIPEAISQLKNKGKLYQLYIANGGGQDTYFNYDTGTNVKSDKKYVPTGNKLLDTIKLPLKVLDKISNINQSIEMTPRLAEFIASLEAGDSIQAAMYNAQEITTNFKRGGDFTKTLDRNGVTFLNAGMQGFLKQIRNVQDAKVNGLRGIANLGIKALFWGTSWMLLNDLIWGDDEDYEELSDYVKNNYYIIGKYGDGNFIRIPKGRVVSIVQKSFEEVWDGLTGEDVDVDQLADLVQNQILPSDPTENNIFSPLIQAFGNENGEAWYGGDLVPSRLQDLPAAEQYDESTDSFSIWLGDLLNVSPYKINYVLDQYSGVIGDLALPYLTKEAETSGIIAPLKDKFTTNSTLNNQNASDFYDLKDELQKQSNSSKATDEDKLKYKYINYINSQTSELYKQKREVQNSSLSDKDKMSKIEEIQSQINDLTETGINNYENVETFENYGKVANVEFYLNSENEWERVKEEEQRDLKELRLTSEEKNAYFKAKVESGIIGNDDNKDSTVKRQEISNVILNTGFDDEKIAYLYSKYYSSEETLEDMMTLKIPIKEYIKLDSQEFTTDYGSNGKAITNSKKNKIINYVNSLNLSIPQKAILIKSQYSSYDSYDRQIVNYVNSQNLSKFDKATILKSIGFDDYNSYIVEEVNSRNISAKEKEEILDDLGFRIVNGRVYW